MDPLDPGSNIFKKIGLGVLLADPGKIHKKRNLFDYCFIFKPSNAACYSYFCLVRKKKEMKAK
jgi:hypothetical protein